MNGEKLAKPTNLAELATVLNQLHEKIAAAPGNTAVVMIDHERLPVMKEPVGIGMTGTVYSIANTGKVVKLVRPVLLEMALHSVLVEGDRAKRFEQELKGEGFLTPQHFSEDPFGIYSVRERVSGQTLTQYLVQKGVIEIAPGRDGQKAVLKAPALLASLIKESPELQNVLAMVERLLAQRAQHPDLINDLGPDNLVLVYEPGSKPPKLQGLSLVDTGPTSKKTRDRLDAVKNADDYLKLSETLVNRYIRTGVFQSHPLADLKPTSPLPSKQPKFNPRHPTAVRRFLESESRNDFVPESSVPKEHQPGGGHFEVEYLFIPAEELHVEDSGQGDQALRNLLFVEVDGKKYVRFSVHPESKHLYQPLFDRFEKSTHALKIGCARWAVSTRAAFCKRMPRPPPAPWWP